MVQITSLLIATAGLLGSVSAQHPSPMPDTCTVGTIYCGHELVNTGNEAGKSRLFLHSRSELPCQPQSSNIYPLKSSLDPESQRRSCRRWPWSSSQHRQPRLRRAVQLHQPHHFGPSRLVRWLGPLPASQQPVLQWQGLLLPRLSGP